MLTRLTVPARLGFLTLCFVPAALQAAPATQPFELLPETAPAPAPATAPATAPARYPEIAQPGYPQTVVTVYSPATNAPPPPNSDFSRNDFSLSLGGQGFTAHGNGGNDTIGFVTFDFAWYFVRDLSVGLELGLSPGTFDRHHHHHDDGEDDGLRAEEEMVLLHWDFLRTGGLALFADGGVGGLHADPDFPSGGRRDSFLAGVGGGLSLRLASHLYASAGARAAWLSGDHDDDRHHGHHWSDGVQYYGELTFAF
ncbi:MAG TPA: hypothetical protein VFE47_02585 [Tepidisphaeraceae bacterium]|jgi:hypothetical protein|nr:hypothetical protein [Tepidisphaeraceae bacterium]